MVETATKATNSENLETEALEHSETSSENSFDNHNMTSLPPEPLYGRDLLQAVENIRADKSEKAIRTGHYTINENGKIRAKNTQFLEALCEAKSIPYKDRANIGKRGRNATYYTKVQQPGSVTVGRRYIEEWGLTPGDPVKIEVKRKQLILRKLEESEIDDFNKREQEEQDQESQENHNYSENNGYHHSEVNSENSETSISASLETNGHSIGEDDYNTSPEETGFDDQLDW